MVEKAKTRGSLRSVLLNRQALDSLALLPTPLNRDQLVFPGNRGGVLNLHNFRRRSWKRALTAAGVAYREPYQMRHTFATLTLADGAPIEFVSRQLGHTSIAVTMRHYAADRPETNYAILDALDARSAQRGLKRDSALEDAT